MRSQALLLLLLVLSEVTRTESAVYVDLSISGSAGVVRPYVSENVTLTCTVSQRSQNRYYSSRSSSDDELIRVRILKGIGISDRPSSWTVYAQMSDTDSAASVKREEITAEGSVSSEASYSTLKITWPKATLTTLGTFICDALIIVSQTSAQLTRSTQLNIGDNLKGKDISRILEKQEEKVLRQVEENNVAVIEQLQNISESVKNMMITQNEKVAEMESKLQGVLDSGFLLYWPIGSYALLSPAAGCPFDATWVWETGFLSLHSESTQRNRDEVSKPNHLQNPSLSRDEGDNFVTQHFCVQAFERTVGPRWPKGSYCINKIRNCPGDFQEGFVLFDGEDDHHKTNYSGRLPDGNYTQDNSQIHYCCRSDGHAEESIYLPTNRAFYLYRHGGLCQSVHGMNVTPEFLTIDTENDDNKDQTGGDAVPDMQLNNIRLELCYYQSI